MSSPILLPGSAKNKHPLKECSRCHDLKEPANGIELGPGKWRCYGCWKGLNRGKR